MVDVLSKMEDSVEDEEWLLAMLIFPSPDWIEELKASYQNYEENHKLMETVQGNSNLPKEFHW